MSNLNQKLNERLADDWSALKIKKIVRSLQYMVSSNDFRKGLAAELSGYLFYLQDTTLDQLYSLLMENQPLGDVNMETSVEFSLVSVLESKMNENKNLFNVLELVVTKLN